MRKTVRLLAAFASLTCLASLTGCLSMSPLHEAAQLGNTNQTLALLDQGANPNQPVPINGLNDNVMGWTPLHFAAANGHADTARALLDRGADVNASINGLTPLHLAVAGRHFDVVRLLVESGAEVQAKTRQGSSSAQIAESRGYTDIAQYLHEAEARTVQGQARVPHSATSASPATAPAKPTESPPPPIY